MQYTLDPWLKKAEILEEVSKYVMEKLYFPPRLSNRVYLSEVCEKFKLPKEIVKEFFIFLYANGRCDIHSTARRDDVYLTPKRHITYSLPQTKIEV